MPLSNLTRIRLLFLGVVALVLLTVGTETAALGSYDDFRIASTQFLVESPVPDQPQAMLTNCLPDGNEPNDNPAQATASTSSMQANLHAPGDVDWYRYNAIGGMWHSVGVDRVPVPYILEVYNESNGQLVTNSLPSKNIAMPDPYNYAHWFAAGTGSYLIKVASPTQAAGFHTCGTSSYTIRFQARTDHPVGGIFQIKGLVYHDDNFSSDWQVEEPPIEAVTVRLLRPDGSVVATQLTRSDGVFHFTDIAAGLYAVEQADSSGFVSTTSNRVIVELFRDRVVYFGDYYLPSRGSLQFLPLQLKQR